MFEVFSHFWWAILPPLFYFGFELLWCDFAIEHSKDSFLAGLKWTYLEIIPPKEIEKSPKVMEALFQGIAGVVVTINPFKFWAHGVRMDRFSLEIVGDEGAMHFYVRTQKKFRNLIEAQIYAQFPDAEIIEVEDYTKKFPKTVPNKNWTLWGTDVQLVEHDLLPIKTYDLFEEDITGTMIDPLAAMAEVIGKLGPGQHIWLQYVLDPQQEVWKKQHMGIIDKLAKKTVKKEKNILEHIIEVLNNIPKAIFGPVEFSSAEAKDDQPLEFRLTPGEKEALKATEDNFSRNFFRVKMRLIVLGRKEVFDRSFVSAFFGTIKQFTDLNLNSFKPEDVSKTYAYYFMTEERLAFRQRKIYRRYRDRDMDGHTFHLSSKELATVWHFPNMEVKAPSISQIQSRRGSAPSNLPIG